MGSLVCLELARDAVNECTLPNKSWQKRKHGTTCVGRWSLRNAKLKRRNIEISPRTKKPDVAPAYYRVSDPSMGLPARMETRDDQTPEPTRPKDVATPAASFCEGCGQRRNEGDRFCGGCGTPL